jgi:pimeloyl-ACP methyl ester carboxylesterase
MQENTLKIWKLDIYYKLFWNLKKGDNNIVILHGWWGSSDSWIQTSELLSNIGYNVIVPDLPWFWKTKLISALTLEEYGIIIENFIKDLNIVWKEGIILWWHSNGGAISIKISNRKKIKISTLILNNSSGIRNDKRRSLKRKFFSFITKKIKVILPKNIQQSKIRRLFYKVIWSQDYLASEKNPKLKETYQNIISLDLKEEIKEVKNNTLLIWWEKDTYTPLSDGLYMRNNIKKSKMITLKDQKHGIHIQNPEILVETFINNI